MFSKICFNSVFVTRYEIPKLDSVTTEVIFSIGTEESSSDDKLSSLDENENPTMITTIAMPVPIPPNILAFNKTRDYHNQDKLLQ